MIPLQPTALTVTAVVVTVRPSSYLEQTLAALEAQDVRPGNVVVVDVGSARSGDPVPPADADGPTIVRLSLPGAGTFGAGVRHAVEQLGPAVGEWLWLLHDDSAPDPSALGELVRAVENKPSVAIAGAKQRDWDDPARLLEVGMTTTPAGRRMTGIELGEVDQGQHDGREDVLAVGLAGALFRTDVWQQLRGTDPAYGLFGDGLEVCRRARLAGHRVIVVPAAAVRHAQAGLRDRRRVDRDPDASPPDSERTVGARRRSALHYRLVAAPPAAVPILVVAMVLAAPFRFAWQLAVKRPARARAELTGVLWAVLNPPRLHRSRSLARSTATLPRRALRPLLASWRDVYAERRDLRLARAELRRNAVASDPLEIAERRRERSRRLAGLGALTLGLVALSAWWFGALLAPLGEGARLVSASLLPSGGDLGALWQDVVEGWTRQGFGAPAPADPILLALLAPTAIMGSVQGGVHLLILTSVLVAGVGAWFAAGTCTRSLGLRAWTALAWISLPVFTLAIGEGRFGALLAHVALPWAALGALRGVGLRAGLGTQPDGDDARAVGSIPAAAGGGLALALAVAAAPALFVPAVVALALIGLGVRRRKGERTYRRNLLLLAAPAAVVMVPLVLAVLTTGWRTAWPALLASPGPAVDAIAPLGWQQLLGWPVAPEGWIGGDGWAARVGEVLPFLVGGLLVLVALGALLRGGPRARGVRCAWVAAAVAFAAAAATSLVVVGRGETVDAHGWSGPALSLMFAALLVACVAGLDGLAGQAARHSFGWRQVAIVVGTVVAVAVPAATLVRAVEVQDLAATEGRGLHLLDREIVPAVGRQLQDPPRQARVLVLEVADDVTYQVLRADGPQLVDSSALLAAQALASGDLPQVEADPTGDGTGDQGAAEPAAPAAVRDPDEILAEVVGALVAGVDTHADELVDLGVAAVLVTPGGTAERVGVVNRLDTIPSLERVAESESGIIWRVAVTEPTDEGTDEVAPGFQPAWARLVTPGADTSTYGTAVDADGAGLRTTIDPEPGHATRRLVLAEQADAGWRATLDGRPLRSVRDGWQQIFEVGEGGGRLVVWYDTQHEALWRGLLIGTAAVYLLLVIPVRRRTVTR